MNRTATAPLIALGIAVTALFSFFIFPGHTYLQQDTQIYVPILERQWSGALSGDPVAEQQHVSFTLYDELTNAVRWLTRLPLQNVLQGEQILFRALGVWGVFLIAQGLGLEAVGALAVAAIVAMGADIPGPAVLAVEYEPTPRAFAVPLVLLSVGLVVRGRYGLGGLAGACAVLLHAPTTWPLWIALAAAAFVNRRISVVFVPLVAAALSLIAVAAFEGGSGQQHLFAKLPSSQESLQRMRTAYDFVSVWWLPQLPRYLLFGVVGLLALWRLRVPRSPLVLFTAFIGIGFVSLPLSYVLLEGAQLAITPQIQPARALLFLVVASSIAATIAGCRALGQRRWPEAACWLVFCVALPFTNPHPVRIETPELAALAQWARSHPGVYAFPEAGRSHAPGWFRSAALQPVYVDWKSGGQVNYLQQFGVDWWHRWQATMSGLLTPTQYNVLGITYVAFSRPAWPESSPVFQNDLWTVYLVTPAQ